MSFRRNLGFAVNWSALAGAAAALAACEDTGSLAQRSLRPIPAETLALMEQVGTTKDAPTLIRAFKKEAEFEIWKMRPDGRYAYLKTYPMCRWSGQLGPKVREGDRQVPEGFYSIGPRQMNPNSSYYLSFNVGYPNAYDRAWGRSGGSIMVHGACSSAGCFSMTDKQIAEIYAIARSSFAGGQRAIQMQSFPFKMTAENLAKHRLDPNIGFWKQLKEGSDHFEVTGQEPSVAVCGKHYVFDAVAAHGQSLDADAACPALKQDDEVKALVAEKQARDDAKIAELAANGVAPVRIVYKDGGQHPDFQAVAADVSRPEALAAAPVEIALGDKAAAKLAAGPPGVAKATQPKTTMRVEATASVAPTQPASQAVAASVAAKAADAAAEPSKVSALAADSGGSNGGFLRGWLRAREETPVPQQPAAGGLEPEQPPPASVPPPPRHTGAKKQLGPSEQALKNKTAPPSPPTSAGAAQAALREAIPPEAASQR